MSEDKENNNKNNNESEGAYKKHSIKIFHSFEEQEAYNLAYSASLTPLECLQHMRKWINLSYGMHGFDFTNLPKKHIIRIITE